MSKQASNSTPFKNGLNPNKSSRETAGVQTEKEKLKAPVKLNVKAVALAVAVATASGCAMLGGGGKDPNTLGGLKAQPHIAQPEVRPVLGAVTRSPELSKLGSPEAAALFALMERYSHALMAAKDPTVRLQIEQRLADLRLSLAEVGEIDATAEDVPTIDRQYGDALTAYKRLLKEYPDHPNRDDILYRLAQSADILGRREMAVSHLEELVRDFPQSDWVIDAWYRLADYAYTAAEYEDAVRGFRIVMAETEAPELRQYAWYMLGWSFFKQNKYGEAKAAFLAGMDQLTDVDKIPGQPGGPEKPGELLKDTLRVMSIIFEEESGVNSLVATLERRPNVLQQSAYEHLLFQSLAEHLLDKKRYQDASGVYRRYTELFPQTIHAQPFQTRLIGVFESAGFGAEVLAEKARYVESFAPDTPYGQSTSAENKAESLKVTRTYLLALSQAAHAQAQSIDKGLRASGKNRYRSAMENARLTAFEQAIDWYARFVSLYPNDDLTPEQYFLMGESLYAIQLFDQAVAAYDRAAYGNKSDTYGKAADAGYAAVVSFEAHLSAMRDVAPIEQRDRIAHGLNFADKYPLHPQASEVRLQMGRRLLALQDFPEALEQANLMISANADPQNPINLPEDLAQGALELAAVSSFEISDFGGAEEYFTQLINLPFKGQTQREIKTFEKKKALWTDQLSASIFKQSEAAVSNEDWAAAVGHLARLSEKTPDNPMREQADYDRATYLMRLSQWTAAVDVLRDFQKRFPRSNLQSSVTVKLASAHDAVGNQNAAAQSYLKIAAKDPDTDVRREALYKAAKLFLDSGDSAAAISAFREYAHNYKKPFARNLESMFQLTELYTVTNAPQKRAFWLRKIIRAHQGAGKDRTERSRYLAAMAQTQFAREKIVNFEAIKLRQPLARSLRRKQTALSEAVESWQAVVDYGVAPFATEGQYRLASVYQHLAQALMNSSRPQGLSTLEAEQYDLLLEEQAFPLEEEAIILHEQNLQNAWSGVYDPWVQKSMDALALIMPARYEREEQGVAYSRFHH